MNTEIESLTVCMPVRNEADVIEFVVNEWMEVLGGINIDSKILIEDGGSNDGTVQILERLEKTHTNLKVEYKNKADGFGPAALRLFQQPVSTWIFFTDSDGQYVASDFLNLWNRRIGNDFVRGIKLGRKDPFMRRVSSLMWNRIIGILFGISEPDLNVGFFLVRTEKARAAASNCKHLKTLVVSELMIRLITSNSVYGRSLYIAHRPRLNGKSRAINTSSLARIGLSHVWGLFLIKREFREL